MLTFFKKKIFRLFQSKKVFKVFYFYHKIFGEKFKDKISNIFISKEFNRLDLINKIIELKKFKSYLEIGCFKDEIFSKINISKVGVDPVSGGSLRLTSDNFFKFNKEKFDLIFIDGLHIYHQVRKDIINSINFLNEGGIILIHDCLPLTYYSQAIPRCQINWNGDVWKFIVEVSTFNDLEVAIINIDEGIGILKKRPGIINKKFLFTDFKKLSYEWYLKNYTKEIKIISYNNLNNFFNDK